MTNVIMIKEIIRIGLDQIVEIREFSMGIITEVDQGMNKTIGMTIGEEILEEIQEHIKIRILEDKIIVVDIEETTGMTVMKEAGVGEEKGNIKIILEGMIEAAVVGQGQDQMWSTNRDRIRCYKC